MKKTVYLLLVLMAVTVSCDKIETEIAKDHVESEKNGTMENSDTLFYKGTLTANASSGDCITPDTRISLNYTDKTDSVSISIYKAKLANGMPAMDIVIPGISIRKEGEITVMTASSSIPLAMGGQPFPRYTVTHFSGNMESDSILFSLLFGSTSTMYGGKATH